MLRDYQQKAIADIHKEWETKRNVLLELPTGAGKTFTFSTIISDMNVPTCVMAHRQELVGQMSLALAKMGVAHRLIASDAVTREIIKAHRMIVGKVWYDPTAAVICASVDTLLNRDARMLENIQLWIIDEAHHVLKKNKWGKCVAMFPETAKGLGVTATPTRADGKGLGSHSDGVFDALVRGPSGQELIDLGYLSPYNCAVIDVKDLDFSHVEHGSTGDFKSNQLRTATKASRRLVGSMVEQYLAKAKGKLGITFCVDIEHAEETTFRYNEAGVPAALVTAKTPLLERVAILEKHRRRELLQLVNVDLFGEGVDIPAVEVVVQGRRTDSFSLFSQQVGRALRPVYAEGYDLSTVEGRKAAIAAGGKPCALILDHVGNIMHHLLPTSRRMWTLDARERRSSNKGVDNLDKLKVCTSDICARPYPAFMLQCPFCGTAPTVVRAARTIEEVDGDLVLLDAEIMAQLNAEAERVMQPVQTPFGLSPVAAAALLKNHNARTRAQQELRDTISLWAGYQKAEGWNVRESQKRFYLKFGIDVMAAQALGAREAGELKTKVEESFNK